MAYKTFQKKTIRHAGIRLHGDMEKVQILNLEMNNLQWKNRISYDKLLREAGEPDNVDLAKIVADMSKLELDFCLSDASSKFSI